MMKKIIVATKNQGKNKKKMINAFKKFTCRTSFFK